MRACVTAGTAWIGRNHSSGRAATRHERNAAWRRQRRKQKKKKAGRVGSPPCVPDSLIPAKDLFSRTAQRETGLRGVNSRNSCCLGPVRGMGMGPRASSVRAREGAEEIISGGERQQYTAHGGGSIGNSWGPNQSTRIKYDYQLNWMHFFLYP